MSKFTTENLIAAGGSLWERGEHRRIYFNNLPELLGWKISRYKTGNISSAKLNGEKVSNTKTRAAMNALNAAKFYLDIPTMRFVGQGLSGEQVHAAVEALGRLVASEEV